jgi:tetratricopeptide (TPR) repeat protein
MTCSIRRPAAAAAALRVLGALGALAMTACSAGPGEAVVADINAARAEQSPEKLLERGRAFAEVGDFTRAEQYLSAALDAGAPADVALPILLKVCIAENRFRVAIAYAEPRLTARPNDFRLRFVVASLYASIGETEKALEHLAQVAKSKPDYAEVQYAIAVLLRDAEHDLIRADAHFREYLRLDPAGRHAEEARGSLLKTVPDPRLPDLGAAGPEGAPAPPAGSATPPAPPASPSQGADRIWKTVP